MCIDDRYQGTGTAPLQGTGTAPLVDTRLRFHDRRFFVMDVGSMREIDVTDEVLSALGLPPRITEVWEIGKDGRP